MRLRLVYCCPASTPTRQENKRFAAHDRLAADLSYTVTACRSKDPDAINLSEKLLTVTDDDFFCGEIPLTVFCVTLLSLSL